jgi:hypothetical protein
VLDGLLTDIRAGPSRSLVLRVEPGIDKTALHSPARVAGQASTRTPTRRMTMRRGTAALAVVAWLCVPSVASSANRPVAPARTATASACSTKGLSFSFRSGTTTQSVKVAHLRATGVTCNTARRVAGSVAKDVLHDRTVPAVVDGFRVSVKHPCGGCTPDTTVSGTSKSGHVTFVVDGGA